MRDGVDLGVFRGIAYVLALYVLGGVFVALFAAGIYAW